VNIFAVFKAMSSSLVNLKVSSLTIVIAKKLKEEELFLRSALRPTTATKVTIGSARFKRNAPLLGETAIMVSSLLSPSVW